MEQQRKTNENKSICDEETNRELNLHQIFLSQRKYSFVDDKKNVINVQSRAWLPNIFRRCLDDFYLGRVYK